jgi:hypothetical protein
MYGVFQPVIRGLEALGRADRMMGRAHQRQQQQHLKKNPFGSYVPNEHDVVVATYAKSGTNWMMQIAHQLAFHGKAEFDHIHCVVPWPDSPPNLGKYAIPVQDTSVWMASPEQKRVIKTHLSWELIPYSEKARYIMVIRDPKDIFVSNYKFAQQMMGPAMPRVETWFKMFLSQGFPVGGSWAVNTAGYWAQRNRSNVLVVSFKSMKRDLDGTVRRVAQFMNVDVPDCVLQEVASKSSFDYMKKIDEKFNVWKVIPWGTPMTMIRKGAQGGSSELISVDQQREIDRHFRAELESLKSDFPYEEFCDLA